MQCETCLSGIDFNIYSSLSDAVAGTNAWQSLAFGSSGEGFPGTSGQNAASSGEFSSIAVTECAATASPSGKASNFYIYDARSHFSVEELSGQPGRLAVRHWRLGFVHQNS